AAGGLEALQRQLPHPPREAGRFFQRALVLARTGRAAEAAAQATQFHRAMQVTAAYQVGLERLGSSSVSSGAGGAPGTFVGYPVLTFNPSMAVPKDDPRAVAAAIRFTDVTAGSGLEGVPALPESLASSLERAVALAVGDYDDDETEDLFVAGHLFRGNLGRFVETSASAGLALRDRPVAAAFGDFDNDGRLDLFVASAGRGVLLQYASRGGWRVVPAAGLAASRGARRGLFGALDDDGDLDLFVAPARAVGDYDNDGFLDLFFTSLDGTDPALYHNRGDGTFELDSRTGPLRRALPGVAGLDAAFFDFDNDGRLDLIVVGKGGVRLFRNDATRGFEDLSSVLPPDLRA